MPPLGEDELQSCSFECVTPVVTLKRPFLQIKKYIYLLNSLQLGFKMNNWFTVNISKF